METTKWFVWLQPWASPFLPSQAVALLKGCRQIPRLAELCQRLEVCGGCFLLATRGEFGQNMGKQWKTRARKWIREHLNTLAEVWLEKLEEKHGDLAIKAYIGTQVWSTVSTRNIGKLIFAHHLYTGLGWCIFPKQQFLPNLSVETALGQLISGAMLE